MADEAGAVNAEAIEQRREQPDLAGVRKAGTGVALARPETLEVDGDNATAFRGRA